MSELTGKFLVIGGVRFAQVQDDPSERAGCTDCAFKRATGNCSVDWREEQAQGLDCIADSAYYEVAQ